MMMGRCAKQVVTATLISQTGERFVGRNDCYRPQKTCPRGSMPSGVGYHLCGSECQQPYHAEVHAVIQAGNQASGATVYLEGHTYACKDCTDYCFEHGVKEIIVGAPPADDRPQASRERGAGYRERGVA